MPAPPINETIIFSSDADRADRLAEAIGPAVRRVERMAVPESVLDRVDDAAPDAVLVDLTG